MTGLKRDWAIALAIVCPIIPVAAVASMSDSTHKVTHKHAVVKEYKGHCTFVPYWGETTGRVVCK